MADVYPKPSRKELAAAAGKVVPDIIATDLRVLFCGINPGLYSGAVGHHFARPGNRFWKALNLSGFTDRLISPFQEKALLEYGLGITNLVSRATAGAADLDPDELRDGAKNLEKKIRQYRPRFVAPLGIQAYRQAFGQRSARIGQQTEGIAGSRVWVLPNPSGLNAHYQIADLARLFGELREAVGSTDI